jgi:drug/metabolite transporter (DMT)-like permease
MLLASVFYGTYGIWSHLMGSSFAPFYQTWVRSIVIMLVMLPVLLATKSFRKIDRQDWPQMAVFVGFCIFTQVPLYYAFNHVPVGTVQLIFYALFLVAAYTTGRLYLGEQITRVKLLSIGLAFVGLALVFGVSVISFAPLGLALAALNGVASGGETASSKKLSDKYPPGLIVFWGWVFTLLTHLPISLLLHEPQPMPAFDAAWGYLLAYSIVNAAAFWLSIEGFRHADASIASLIGLMEVVFAVVFAAVIFHQAITGAVIAGGAFIIFAAMLPDLLAIIHGKRSKEPIEPVREL